MNENQQSENQQVGNLPIPLSEAQKHGWTGLVDAHDLAADAVVIAISALDPVAGAIARLGGGLFKSALIKRALHRINWVLQQLIVDRQRTREAFGENIAELHCALHDLGQKCRDEPFDQKIRYFTELLDGRMSEERALSKDKYYRFRRCVEQLDLIALRSISRFSSETAQQEEFKPKIATVREVYSPGDAGPGPCIVTNREYAHSLVRGEPTSVWEFIGQLEAVGVMFFDRGGGAATPLEGSTCLWHRDAAEFAEFLRNADQRTKWEGAELK